MFEYRLWFAVLKLAIRDYATYLKNGKPTATLTENHFNSAKAFLFDGKSNFDLVCHYNKVDPDRLRSKILANPREVNKAMRKTQSMKVEIEHEVNECLV